MSLRREARVRRGDRIEVGVSEPWAFVSDRGRGPFAGRVADLVEDRQEPGRPQRALVLELDEAFRYEGVEWRTLLMTPRTGPADDLLRLGDDRHKDGNLAPLDGPDGVFVIAYIRRLG